MRFSAFWMMSGVMVGVAATKTSATESAWALLFVAAIAMAIVGAAYEVFNRDPR